MDLQEAWNNLDREQLSKPVGGAVEIQKASKHPVQKLIWTFRYGLGFIVLFEIMFISIFITVPQPLVRIFMGLIIVIYLFGFWINFRMLQNIEHHYILDANFKESLQQIYQSTKDSLAFQRKAAILVYPVACTAGFMWGLSIEKDVAEMMQKAYVIISLVISIAILTPLSYYLAVWLENISYGKYLKQLETLLNDLNEVG